MFILPREKQSWQQVFVNAFALYREYFWQVLPLSLFMGILFILPEYLQGDWFVDSRLNVAKEYVVIFLFSLIASLAWAFIQTAGWQFMRRREKFSWHTIQTVLNKTDKIISSEIVHWLLVMSCSILASVLFMPLLMLNHGLAQMVSSMVFGLLLGIQFLIMFYLPLIILTDMPVLAAFIHSARWVRDHWWYVLSIILPVVLLFALGFVGLLMLGNKAGISVLLQGVFLVYVLPLLNAVFLLLFLELHRHSQ